MVQVPVVVVTSIIGVWLFAVQHRFDDALWMQKAEWGFAKAALEGSSYLQLAPVLQWFTGNIGFHNLHHFSPRIPNYRLESCFCATTEFRERSVVTLGEALRTVRLVLWDEDQNRLVGFRDLQRLTHIGGLHLSQRSGQTP
jgi:omega-6 fatty acid desaturase (delta-12 desaturase)